MTPVFTGPLAGPVIVHDPAGLDKFFMRANAAQKTHRDCKTPGFLAATRFARFRRSVLVDQIDSDAGRLRHLIHQVMRALQAAIRT